MHDKGKIMIEEMEYPFKVEILPRSKKVIKFSSECINNRNNLSNIPKIWSGKRIGKITCLEAKSLGKVHDFREEQIKFCNLMSKNIFLNLLRIIGLNNLKPGFTEHGRLLVQ
jgi:hypothetical protein